ncbi:MAG: hypothetical protein Kow00114_37450 [Kiloniellaceae bacterium]
MYYERFYDAGGFMDALAAFAEREPGHGERVMRQLRRFESRKASRGTLLRGERGREFHLLPEVEDPGRWLLLIETFREQSGGQTANAMRGHLFASYGDQRTRQLLIRRFTAYAENDLGI